MNEWTPPNQVILGDCQKLVSSIPDHSIDVVVTSPPYWGQRSSLGVGVEDDPREYIKNLVRLFVSLLPKLKEDGIIWINLGDAYNTPVNWKPEDRKYSSLGTGGVGLSPNNSAYTKPRAARKAFVDREVSWLQYGNLLALPYRLTIALCDAGYLFRGEVIWKKLNPMPEGRCRRPHRSHESIYLFSKREQHAFQTAPPIKSVWEFPNDKQVGKKHHSRFPMELPRRCILALGRADQSVVVLDPFAGSGTTGLAALELGCSFIGCEIDEEQVVAANVRIKSNAKYVSKP